MQCIACNVSLLVYEVYPQQYISCNSVAQPLFWPQTVNSLAHIPRWPNFMFSQGLLLTHISLEFSYFSRTKFSHFFENKKKEKVSQPSQFHVCSTTSLSENKLLYLFVFSLIPAWDFTLICFQGVLKPQMSCNCCSIGFQGVLKPQMSRSNGCFHFLISTIFPPQLFQIYALCVDSCLPSNSR